MKPVVVTNTPRVERTIVDRLAELGVATTHEAMGRTGLLKPYMRPIWAGAQGGQRRNGSGAAGR